MKKILLFLLFLLPSLFFAQVSSIIHCAGDNVFDLTSRYNELTKDINPNQTITIKYYTKDTYATNDVYAIEDPKNFVFNETSLQIHVRIKTSGGASYMNSFNIILNSAVNIPYATITYPGCNYQKLTIGATGGKSPYTYSIDGINYQTTNVFNDIAPGTYNLSVKDSYNCTATTTKIVDPVYAFTATVVKKDNYCFNTNDGRIEVIAAGGKLPYTYSLDENGERASNVFLNLAPGYHTVTVKDATACSHTFTVLILSPEPLRSTWIIGNVSAPDANDGEITVTAFGGTYPYSYLLRDMNGTPIRPFQPSNKFVGLPAGTYNIEIRDAKSCSTVGQATIAAPSNLNLSAISTNVTCNTPTGTITANATGGSGSYLYSLDNGIFGVSNVFSNLSPGNYILNVKDSQNFIKSVPATISSFSPLTAIASNTPINGCSINYNSTITIAATGGKLPYQYAVNSSTNFQQSNTFFGAAPGTHNITVKDDNGCTFTTNLVITSPVLLSTTVNITEAKICGNKDSVTITATGGQAPYHYSFTGGNNYSDEATSELSPGSYTLFVKDSYGCIATQYVTVLPSTLPVSTVSAYTNTTSPNSNNGSITMTTSGGILPYSYSLLNNGILVASQNSNIFTNLGPGTYSVRVTDAKGCSSQMEQIVILAPTTNLLATATINQPNCINPAGIITITASGGSGNYQYSIDNGVTYSYTNIYTVFNPGNYAITVRDSENAIYSFNLVVLPLNPMALTATIVSMPSCISNGIIMAHAIGGQSPISYSINGSTFQQTNIFDNITPGTYSIAARDTNGCIETVIITLDPPALITSTFTIENQNITINTTGGTGQYQYSLDRINYQSSNIFTALSYGNYQIYVRDLNGCIEEVAGITLNPPSPLIEGKDEVIISFKPGQTLGDLIIEGQNIKWYSNKTAFTGKTSKTTETTLPLSTVLVDGTTYYASQTINGIESTERLAVTAKLNGSLSNADFILPNFKYYPNPVAQILSISNDSEIDEIEVLSVSGKSILNKKINNTHSEVDLSNVASGFYFLKVKSEGKTKTIKIVKK